MEHGPVADFTPFLAPRDSGGKLHDQPPTDRPSKQRRALVFLVPLGTLLVLLALLAGNTFLAGAAGSYHYVAPDGVDSAQCTVYNPCRTIQRAAANAAPTGNEIRVAAGYYTATVTLNKNLIVRGGFTTTNWVTPNPQQNVTVLDAQGAEHAIQVPNNAIVTVSGFHITGGSSSLDGGGVYNQGGTLTLENNQIYGNSADSGGALANGTVGTPATLILRGNKIFSNTAQTGGALIVRSGTVTLEASEFFDNNANLAGGAFFISSGDVTIRSCLIYNNTTGAFGGGGIFVNNGNVKLENDTFYDNSTTNNGGGIYAYEGTVAITDSLIISNTAPTAGGGIYSDTIGAGLSVAYTDFFGNSSDHIEDLNGSIDPTAFGSNNRISDPQFVDPAGFDLHISSSSPARDTGIESGATIDFEGNGRPYGSAMDRGADEYTPPNTCFARPQDGPVYTSVQDAINAPSNSDLIQIAGTCTGVTLQGGLYQTAYISRSLTLQGGYTVTNWLEPIYGPAILDADRLGRVIYVTSTTATDVTIENLLILNGDDTSGAGVYLGPNVSAILQNNIIRHNTAVDLGGGVFVDGGYAELQHNTIYSNTAGDYGGGVYVRGAATLANNIVVNNQAVIGGGVSIYTGASVTLAYNDFYGNTPNDYGPLSPGTTDISAPPGFVNAGAGDFHLTLTSPAVNAADPASDLTTDFEGESRPLGTRSDMGADESRWYADVDLGDAPNSPFPVTDIDLIRGESITFTHTITNVGNMPASTDSFVLSTHNTDDWDVALSVASPVILSQGESLTFDVVVSVPLTATEPINNQTTITATSQTNTTGFDTTQDIIVRPGLEFAPSYTENADPGEVITYTHTLTNTGPTDTFTLAFATSRGWGELITPTSPITLSYQETAQVIVRVEVVATAPANLTDVTTVKATSSYSIGITATVTDTTISNPTTGNRYVATSGGTDTNNNCTQQDHPCKTISYAVNQAAWGDAIFVAQGVYYEQDIQLNQYVNLHGGYIYSGGSFNLPGGGIDPSTTIIDTQGGGRGLRINVASAYNPVISGFTIQNGTTSGYGGSIYVQGSSAPTLTLLILVDSSATRGGGIYVEGGAPVIQNVAITGTLATDRGGGIYINAGNVAIQNVVISGTIASDGAGLYLASGNTIAEELRVTGSMASDQGGGVYHAAGTLTLTRSRIGENSAEVGGGIYHPNGTLNLWNTFVYSNTASTGAGGGVHHSGGTLDLINDTLYGNQAATTGGGYFDSGSGATVISNTIVAANSATTGGGIYHTSAGTLAIDYNNIWNNAASSFPNSNVFIGLNSVSIDPLFVDASTGDLHITFESPCNDVADPTTFLTTDIDGDLRPSNQGFDIGADELAGCLAKNQRTGQVYGVLQTAIDEAQNSDIILVSGTCQGVQPRVVGGQAISQTAFISKSLTLAGGYDSSFSNNPETSPVTTTLDARGMGRTLVITGPVPVIVSRFTLTGGDATGLGGGPGGASAGGALYSYNSILQLEGLTIVGNQATYGGGAYSFGGTVMWQGELSQIAGNSATYGGGFYLDGGVPTVTSASFVGNSAEEGGGIYNASSSTTISKTNFLSNTASIGGGLYNATGLTSIEVITAAYNSANTGGGFYNGSGAQLSLQSAIVLNNTASGHGGGVYNAATGDLTIVNTLVVSNTASTGDGGGLYNLSPQLTVRHDTFYGNSTSSQGGGIYHNSGSSLPVINSSLFVGNTAGAGGGIYSGNADPDFDFNDVYANSGGDYGGLLLSTDGIGNISADPSFISTDPTSVDFLRIPGSSPAEDTGDPSSPITVDIEGDPRPSNRGFDIGADEVGGCYVRINGLAPTYGSIQLAINLSNPGDKLYVAGTCTGVNLAVDGGQAISQTVFLTKSLTIQGGYTTTNWITPDPAVYTTTLDALSLGHVVYVTGSVTVTIDGLHLRGGLAVDGGAIFAGSGTLTVTRSHILSNNAVNGGALYNLAATTTISGCQVYSNTATLGGGAYSAGGVLTFTSNDVRFNEAADKGGGFYHAGGSANVQNNIIRNNQALEGGGVYNAGTGLGIVHNTFYINTATTGGGLYSTNGDPTVVSNIFYNNAASTGTAIYGPASLTPDYNDVMPPSGAYSGGVLAGAHTLFVDPLFVDAPSGDFHIQDDSPVIDMGDPSVMVLRDFEGDYRPADQGFDIGADERQGCWARIVRTGVIYGNPQWAIDASIPGDVIQVTIGECRGVHSYNDGGTVISQTIHIPHDLTIDGGYKRDFSGLASPRQYAYPDPNATTLNPMGLGRAVLVTNSATVTMTRLILVNGDAAGLGGGPSSADAGGAIYFNDSDGILESVDVYSSTADYGGAIYNTSGDIDIHDNWLSFNTATNDGGAIYNASGTMTITTLAADDGGTRMFSNTAGNQGGGIYNDSGSLLILDNSIDVDGGQSAQNSADEGGYLYNNIGQAYLENNTIYSNSAKDGGAIYNNTGTLVLEGNDIYNNSVTSGGLGSGGGLFNNGGVVTIDGGNQFHENSADGYGGAIYSAGSLTVRNTLIYSNTARDQGGGIYFNSGSGSILHNTFYNNGVTAPTGQGGCLYVASGSPTVKNTIFYACWAGIDGGAVVAPTSAVLDYNDYYLNVPNDVSGGASAGGNSFYLDPQLMDVGAADFHLGMFSPMIDVAEDLGVSRDFEGDPRPINLGPDIGADEYNACLARVESSGNIYGRIGEALANAESGDTILVAEGVCYENVLITDDITISGSWEKDFSEQIVDTDGALLVSTYIDASGSGRVVTVNSSASIVSIAGVALINGNATNGGGIWSAASDFTMSYSAVYANTATTGGGVYIDSGTALLETVEVGDPFNGNTAATHGGGIYVASGTDVTIRNGGILYNQALGGNGGGLYVSSGSQVDFGGGSPVEWNEASGDGGGIYIGAATFDLGQKQVNSNTAGGSGGGIYVASNSDLTLINLGLYDNTATSGDGGGLYRNGSGGSVEMQHATIRLNSAPSGQGGGVYNTGSPMDINASIIASNSSASGGSGIHGDTGANVTITYSLRWINTYVGVTSGIGNIVGDPRIIDPSGNLHYTSPAIDAVPTAASSVDIDRTLDPRPQLCDKDMGRDEYAVGVRDLDWDESPTPDQQNGDPGETLYYTFTLTNNSEHWLDLSDSDSTLGPGTGYTETVTFNVNSSQGWAEIISITGGAHTTIAPDGQSATTEIGPGYTAVVLVQVTIPPDAYASLPEDDNTKELTSLSYQARQCPTGPPRTGTSARATTLVNEIRDFIVEPDNDGTALPGETITYTHTLTNTGNITDTYDIIPKVGFYASAEIIQPSSGQVTLTPHQTATLVIAVTINPEAAGGLTDVTSVIIRSNREPLLEKAAANNTFIQYTTGTRYVSLSGQDSLVDESELTGEDYKDNNCTQPGVAACRTIQQAIDQAADGDLIKIDQGTYTDTYTTTYKTQTITQTAFIDKSVTLQGGYDKDNWEESPPDHTAQPTIIDPADGRAFYVTEGITVTIDRLVIRNGDATGLGGGPSDEDAGGSIYNEGANLMLNAVRIYGSTADLGGGLYHGGGDLTLQNNLFHGNAAGTDGGAVYAYTGGVTLWNNTFHTNVSSGDGSALYVAGGNLIVANTIFANNSGGGAISGTPATAALDYNLYFSNTSSNTGGTIPAPGGNDILANPLFVAPGDNPPDLHLQSGSPAREAGDPGTDTEQMPWDYENNPRLLGHRVDIGAYEYVIEPGVLIEPDHTNLVPQGTAITYTHTLTNTGDLTDTIDITVDSSQGWATLLTPASVELTPYQTATVQVRIDVPPTGVGGVTDVTVVTAQSQMSPSTFDTATDTTEVEMVAGVIFAPNRSGNADPGTVITYTHTITNTGDGPDTFDITHASSQGWDITYDTHVSVGYGMTATVIVSVTVPANATSGTMDATLLTATSQHDFTVLDSVVDATTVNQVAGVELEPDNAASVSPGTTITYTHTITNTGNGPDTFTLQATSSQGWLASFSPSSVPLAAGAAYPVVVTITVPSGATAGMVDTTTITATSQYDPSVWANATDVTTVICQALTGVTVDGPTSGFTGTLYTFTGNTTPPDATPPIIYTWSPEPASGQSTTSAQYQWATPGIYTVTLTAENCGGIFIDTHTITITEPSVCPVPLTGATITGPTNGFTGTLYTFTGNITPPDATPPITYTWSPEPASGQSTASAQYRWATPGVYTVTLTAENCGGTFIDTHTITISAPPVCSIPLEDVTIVGPTEGDINTLYTFVGFTTPPDATPPIFYTWSPEPITGQSTVSPQYQWDTPGTYTVTLTAENCGGIATDIHTITISEPPGSSTYLPLMMRNYSPGPVPDGPDLVVVNISVDQPIVAGEPTTVRVTIQNQGNQPVAFGNNFYVDLYVDRQPTPLLAGDIAWGVQGAWFDAGDMVVLTAPYTFTSGTHQLYAQADTDNSVVERYENNNTRGPVAVDAEGTWGEDLIIPTPPKSDKPRPTPTPMPQE